MTMKLFPLIIAIALALAVPQALSQTHVWDTSTDSGYQNANGTWGTDNFWTTNSGANSGTVLAGWTNTSGAAWFGGNSLTGTNAASPNGNFTVTVSGTQTAKTVRQITNGVGNFTLTGGTLVLMGDGVRADRGTFTVNSVITNSNGVTIMHLNVQSATGLLIVGGNNTYTATSQIRGAAGGIVRLNNAGALGTGSSVQFVESSVLLDLNGFDVSGKTITVNNSQTAFLGNSSATKSVWSGNVTLTNTTAVNLRAGGTNGEVEISGVISGGSRNQVQSFDGGRLRLSGANTYDGTNVVRDNSTLIVGNASALGSTVSGTFINTGATLDLNGFNVGNEAFTLQQATSRLVNSNTTTAATVGGGVTLGATSSGTGGIGGNGDLTIAGVVSGATFGFTKVGSGTLTLAGTTFYGGNTVVESGQLVLATNGSLRFVIGGSGTNNAVLGSGNAVMNGRFAFDLASASTNTNATWTIVTNTLVETYGASFIVSGFSGNAASGLWTNTTNGVDYVFSQSSGVLSVQPASSVPPYNAWVAFWQTNSAGFTNTAGTDNPDGDPFNNNMEFAFDGNPTVGTPALMTVTPVGSNAVFNWIERTNGVIYEVQKNSTLTNAWAAATGLSISNSTNTSNVLPAPAYVRKEFIITNATGKDFYRVRATIQP